MAWCLTLLVLLRVILLNVVAPGLIDSPIILQNTIGFSQKEFFLPKNIALQFSIEQIKFGTHSMKKLYYKHATIVNDDSSA
jgi:hypothetical protein